MDLHCGDAESGFGRRCPLKNLKDIAAIVFEIFKTVKF